MHSARDGSALHTRGHGGVLVAHSDTLRGVSFVSGTPSQVRLLETAHFGEIGVYGEILRPLSPKRLFEGGESSVEAEFSGSHTMHVGERP